GKKVSLESPDIVILVDTGIDSVSVTVRPLFIRGRYRKLVRGIPQTAWPCSRCRGKGCERCGQTGKMYSESVEELIVPPILEHTRGDKAVFHGAGREDIDARMLGGGRPFIVEVKTPRKRFLDLNMLRCDINNFAKGKVEVVDLSYSHRGEVVELKEKTGVKRYNATVHLDREVKPEDIGKVESLVGVVEQRTPKRVLHRRADKVRRKKVYRVEVVSAQGKTLRLVVECEGGLYVKEFITGDEGRTTPSVAETLGTQARCVELDVIHVDLGDGKSG
ncbi:MAG: tRNA pseudouridine(54/55) synthase Pus10, partial [Methanobacteriota archaeon]